MQVFVTYPSSAMVTIPAAQQIVLSRQELTVVFAQLAMQQEHALMMKRRMVTAATPYVMMTAV
jgi:hypothetical protein